MASIQLIKVPQSTGSVRRGPDEYLAVPIWVAAQTGRWFTRVHTLVGMGVLAHETVDQRPYGSVQCTKPGHVKSLLEEKGLTPDKVDRNMEAWIAELRSHVDAGKARRARNQGKVAPKPLSEVQMVLGMIKARIEAEKM